MKQLKIRLQNCYGIKALTTTLDFSSSRAAAVYAPNGAMKSSFAQTFQDVADGSPSKDRIFPKRTTLREITDESGAALNSDNIVVLHPYNEVFGTSEKISTLLVDSALRKEYEQLLADITTAKEAFLASLRELSGSKKLTEEVVSLTFNKTADEFYEALVRVKQEVVDQEGAPYANIQYDRVFDEKIIAFLEAPAVKLILHDYIQKYDQLISASTYFKKGTFNYYNAETIAKSLAVNGFFDAKHAVILNGTEKIEISTEKELSKLILDEKNAITNDKELKRKFAALEKMLEKNSDLRGFHAYLLEHDALLPKLSNINKFKEELLKSYFKTKSVQYFDLVSRHLNTVKRKREIEEVARSQRTQWERTIEIFNDRFYVPFKLVPKNKIAVMLKKSAALSLGFTFEDAGEEATIEKEALLQSLSTGEKKALYILNIIFEVEARKKDEQETVFVVDDIADSFDYKNKYAIIEYLRDISEVEHFAQIILTHNFDFFRTICDRVVPYTNCKMAFKTAKGLSLDQASGIKNVFVRDLKKDFFTVPRKKIASIPFIRNMIEYARDESDVEFIKLTALLHWKDNSAKITIGELDVAYKSIFADPGTSADPEKPVLDLLSEAVTECMRAGAGFNFENKIVLSIAIRLKAEKYMIRKLADPSFVASIGANQTNKLFVKYKRVFALDEEAIQVLQKVILMTPESIHLNSFMYEPLLDMSDEHLRKLHQAVEILD